MPNDEFYIQGLASEDREALQTANIGTFNEGIYKITNRDLIGGANVQPFKDGIAVIEYGLLPQYRNEVTESKALSALIDHYGTYYESVYESFITVVDSPEESQKMEKSGWTMDSSLSEEWSQELNDRKIVFFHNNPHYVAENDFPSTHLI